MQELLRLDPLGRGISRCAIGEAQARASRGSSSEDLRCEVDISKFARGRRKKAFDAISPNLHNSSVCFADPVRARVWGDDGEIVAVIAGTTSPSSAEPCCEYPRCPDRWDRGGEIYGKKKAESVLDKEVPRKPRTLGVKTANGSGNGKGDNLRLYCRAALPARERFAIELVEIAILHDGHEPLLPLQNRHVDKRVAIDKQQVGEIALAHLAELVAHVHQFGADTRRAGERFARAVAEQLNEVLKVSRIGALRCDVETVVATDHYTDATLAHLLVGPDRGC